MKRPLLILIVLAAGVVIVAGVAGIHHREAEPPPITPTPPTTLITPTPLPAPVAAQPSWAQPALPSTLAPMPPGGWIDPLAHRPAPAALLAIGSEAPLLAKELTKEQVLALVAESWNQVGSSGLTAASQRAADDAVWRLSGEALHRWPELAKDQDLMRRRLYAGERLDPLPEGLDEALWTYARAMANAGRDGEPDPGSLRRAAEREVQRAINERHPAAAAVYGGAILAHSTGSAEQGAAQLARGRALALGDEKAAAITAFRAATASSESSVRCAAWQWMLALARQDLRNPDTIEAADALLGEANANVEQRSEALLGRAKARMLLDDPGGALIDCRAVSAQFPDSAQAQQAQMLLKTLQAQMLQQAQQP